MYRTSYISVLYVHLPLKKLTEKQAARKEQGAVLKAD